MILRNQTLDYSHIQVAASLYVRDNLFVCDEDGEVIEIVSCARLHTEREISKVNGWQFTSNSMAPRVVIEEPETQEGLKACRSLKRHKGRLSEFVIPEIMEMEGYQELKGW